jgi:hypothetical protein
MNQPPAKAIVKPLDYYNILTAKRTSPSLDISKIPGKTFLLYIYYIL